MTTLLTYTYRGLETTDTEVGGDFALADHLDRRVILTEEQLTVREGACVSDVEASMTLPDGGEASLRLLDALLVAMDMADEYEVVPKKNT
ncbi:hypothetical protein ACFWZ7_24760 [Nocardiopsis alba]|uniref:hypothetical protein n=1 Tax=Nocardiopsis alba TaxID=53437 RepID=UPI003670B631